MSDDEPILVSDYPHLWYSIVCMLTITDSVGNQALHLVIQEVGERSLKLIDLCDREEIDQLEKVTAEMSLNDLKLLARGETEVLGLKMAQPEYQLLDKIFGAFVDGVLEL